MRDRSLRVPTRVRFPLVSGEEEIVREILRRVEVDERKPESRIAVPQPRGVLVELVVAQRLDGVIMCRPMISEPLVNAPNDEPPPVVLANTGIQ